MFRESSTSESEALAESRFQPISRSAAMSQLQELGYTSDSPNWQGLLRLIEKGYIQTQDLQRHQI